MAINGDVVEEVKPKKTTKKPQQKQQKNQRQKRGRQRKILIYGRNRSYRPNSRETMIESRATNTRNFDVWRTKRY